VYWLSSQLEDQTGPLDSLSGIQAIVAQVLVAGVSASTDGSWRRVVAACYHDSRVVDFGST